MNAMNASEKQLDSFLESKKGENIKIRLRPQGDQTIILPEEVNLCVVTKLLDGREIDPLTKIPYFKEYNWFFGGISEKVFNYLIDKYEIR